MNAQIQTYDDPEHKYRTISLSLQITRLDQVEMKSVRWFKLKIWLWMTWLMIKAEA